MNAPTPTPERSEVRGERSEEILAAIRHHLANYHAVVVATAGNRSSRAWYFIECVEHLLGQRAGAYDAQGVAARHEEAARALHAERGGTWDEADFQAVRLMESAEVQDVGGVHTATHPDFALCAKSIEGHAQALSALRGLIRAELLKRASQWRRAS